MEGVLENLRQGLQRLDEQREEERQSLDRQRAALEQTLGRQLNKEELIFQGQVRVCRDDENLESVVLILPPLLLEKWGVDHFPDPICSLNFRKSSVLDGQ